MNSIIKTEHLTRKFKLKSSEYKIAVNNISLNIKEGEIFGILGPNGAGKTTLIKILTTLLLPTEGKASIFGLDIIKNAEKIREKINFVYGGEKGVYNRLTPQEYLTYFCVLYKIPPKKHLEITNELLKKVDLFKAKDQVIQTFSKGMIQRLHIARSLINSPKVIFLDEPTIGLDPTGANLLRQIVRSLAKNGITVILTTHYMQEADDLCDRIAIIKNGEIVMIDTPQIIKETYSNNYIYESLVFVNDMSLLKNESSLYDLESKQIKENLYFLKFKASEPNDNQLVETLSQYSEVVKLDRCEVTLEDAYLNIIN